jgi:hypothetical protein
MAILICTATCFPFSFIMCPVGGLFRQQIEISKILHFMSLLLIAIIKASRMMEEQQHVVLPSARFMCLVS